MMTAACGCLDIRQAPYIPRMNLDLTDSRMNLDLTDEEAAALTNELHEIVEMTLPVLAPQGWRVIG
jgi:hypothetical protein